MSKFHNYSFNNIVAILKHIASKNANYGSAIDYLKYQHDEFHLVPVLDENGNMMLRDEFCVGGQRDKELQTVCANVDNILGTEREAQREQQQSRKNEHSL